jgi:hypothetical protein
MEVLASANEYQFAVTDDPFSSGDDRFVLYLMPAGQAPVLEKENVTKFSVYPNPTADKVTVRVNSHEPATAVIYSTLGVQVAAPSELMESGNQRMGQFDLTMQPAGVYILQVKSGTNVYNKRIVKQ